MRADVWLWRARLFKTRSGAARAIEAGAVRLFRNGASRVISKPAEPVGVGDGLVVSTPGGVAAMRVVGVGVRRGPPAEARALYEPAVEQE